MSIKKKLSSWLNINRGISNRNDKASVFCWVWGYITTSQIEGDYIEFGVYQGGTFVESWRQWFSYKKWVDKQLKSSEKWRNEAWNEYSHNEPKFYGIDSFSGIPKNNESDTHFLEGTYSADRELVYNKCIKEGMDKDRFELVQSFYSDLTIENLPKKASVIHIDSDIYQSAIEALRLCRSSIQQGTVVLFDDYNCFSASNNQGERRAIKEFSKESGIEFEPWFAYRNVGQAFICHLEEL